MKSASNIPQYPIKDPEYLKRFDHWQLSPEISRARSVKLLKKTMEDRVKELVVVKKEEVEKERVR